MTIKANILGDKDIDRITTRISHEILEKNKGTKDLVLVGIKTRGVPFAYRIQKKIEEIEDIRVPVEELDITFYRDDLSKKNNGPIIKNKININIDKKIVVLVDDVIFTGRTVRAALDGLVESGRARKVQLAVLIDRGHRELPIRPDFVGKNMPTSKEEIVSVEFKEVDGINRVSILE